MSAPPLSPQAYANHRGVSLPTIRRAIRRGRLKKSVAMIDGFPRIVDVALADQEMEASADHTTTPPAVRERVEARPPKAAPTPAPAPRPPPPARPRTPREDDEPPDVSDSMTMAEASVVEKRWRARLVQLEYRKKAAELVEAKDVEAEWLKLVLAARTKLLGVATRARQRLPHLKNSDVAEIDAIVREALDALSEGYDDSDDTDEDTQAPNIDPTPTDGPG